MQVPGRPRLYRTTKKFLRDFHLGSLEELPEMPGLEADGQLRMTEERHDPRPQRHDGKRRQHSRKQGNTDRVKHKNRVKRKKREVVD